MIKTFSVGDIGNYYGGLEIKEEDGKFYWGIENYDGTEFEEIPEHLYIELYKLRDLDFED